MRRRTIVLAALLAAAALGGPGLAQAHECTYDQSTGEELECHETPVAPNWRDGNYVPLFDITDRNDDSYDGQRWRAQRWREECSGYDSAGRYRSSQQCAWVYGGSSFFNRYGQLAPNEYHVGYAASHCFLFEAAHDCSDHQASRGEGVHDAHGGATYADVCFQPNRESKYCDDGMTDTQVGLTIMDHNPCGLVVPVVACTDEYHVVRPFDSAYTMEQQEQSVAYIQRIAGDPETYLCGKPERGGCPFLPNSHRHGSPGQDDAGTVNPGTRAARALEGITAQRPAVDRTTDATYRIAGAPVRTRPSGGSAAPVSGGSRDTVAVWLLAGLVAALGMRARVVLDPR